MNIDCPWFTPGEPLTPEQEYELDVYFATPGFPISYFERRLGLPRYRLPVDRLGIFNYYADAVIDNLKSITREDCLEIVRLYPESHPVPVQIQVMREIAEGGNYLEISRAFAVTPEQMIRWRRNGPATGNSFWPSHPALAELADAYRLKDWHVRKRTSRPRTANHVIKFADGSVEKFFTMRSARRFIADNCRTTTDGPIVCFIDGARKTLDGDIQHIQL